MSRYVLTAFTMLLAIPLFPEQAAPSPWRTFYCSGTAQGTTYHITYYSKGPVVSKNTVDSILDKIDSSLSIYKPYSLISRFNDAPQGLEMDEHLRRVVHKSLEIFKATGGISDITIFPLMRIWGFGPDRNREAPDSAIIRSVMPCIGSGKLHVRGNRLIKDLPCVKIDVNGIAQGYSVDVVAAFLERKGIGNYLVEIGGEIRIRGRKQPGGAPMEIGIEAPAESNAAEPVIKKIIQPAQGAITTSGNYRKYHKQGGRIVSHLMDPHTGYPFQNELISVTVLAPDAITADGYDNALMGMGLKKALAFLKTRRQLDAYFIYRLADGSVSDTATAGFYKFLASGRLMPAED
jgi:thiamine biosynthesis lipoprotein